MDEAEPVEAKPEPLRLCASDELKERGNAHVFDVLQYREPARAFVMRFEGQIVAYLNRCLHVPTEMDWQYGEFLDSDKEFIICSIHGAVYEPTNGRCIAGPCAGQRLMPVDVVERDGEVYWYPSADVRPVEFDAISPDSTP